jgi:hypothetical protein
LNGKKINTLHDIVIAKESPKDGFHVLEFREGDNLRRMILDAAQVDQTTERVLERYGIDKDRHLVVPTPGRSDKLARE